LITNSIIMKKRLVIVDDHELFATGLQQMLEEDGQWEVIASLRNGLAAVEQVPQLQPDLMMMDLDMPIMDGLQALKSLRPKMPDLPIVILSMHGEKAVVQKLMQEGAQAYLLKNSSKAEFLRGIDTVLQGGRFYSSLLTETLLQPELVQVKQSSMRLKSILSDREIEVLRLLAEGNTSKEIAESLSLSAQTIDSHRKNLLKKLEARNVADLVRIAFREGLVD
ncbi:MAG: response regulator transcription factor, partial [Bacteroidota bacterium]